MHCVRLLCVVSRSVVFYVFCRAVLSVVSGYMCCVYCMSFIMLCCAVCSVRLCCVVIICCVLCQAVLCVSRILLFGSKRCVRLHGLCRIMLCCAVRCVRLGLCCAFTLLCVVSWCPVFHVLCYSAVLSINLFCYAKHFCVKLRCVMLCCIVLCCVKMTCAALVLRCAVRFYAPLAKAKLNSSRSACLCAESPDPW